MPEQNARRHQKADSDGDETGQNRRHRAQSAQFMLGRGDIPVGGLMILAAAPADPLERDHQQHEAEHNERNLCCPAGIAHAKPNVEDRAGECIDREEVDGAEIGQRLHQSQCDPHDDRRARQRQRNVEEGLPGISAEGAAHLEQDRRLFLERCARQ